MNELRKTRIIASEAQPSVAISKLNREPVVSEAEPSSIEKRKYLYRHRTQDEQ